MSKYGYVIASNRVVRDRHRVGWMYKVEPTDENDSGWRIFSGNEDEQYKEVPGNFGIYDADTIIAIDPDIEAFLLDEIGTEVELDPSGGLTVISL